MPLMLGFEPRTFQPDHRHSYCSTLHPAGGGGGVILQIFSCQVQHVKKKWTQSDLRFCENDGSKISNINEKGGQLN